MARIPVGKTILFAYGFLFGQIGTVLQVAGIPALAFAGADYVSRSIAASQGAFDAGAEPSGSAVLASLISMLVAVAASSAAAIAVTRVVLAREGAPPRLPMGESVLRMTAANARFILGMFVLIAFAATVSYFAYQLAGVPLDGAAEVQPTLAIVAAGLLSWAVFLYAFVSAVRMGFLLPAVVASEPKAGLIRSHALTQGNTWRVVAIVFALGLPIAALVGAAGFAVMRSALGPDFMPQEITPELVQRVQAAIYRQLAAWEVFNAVMFVLYSGLIYSGVAYAYRAAAASDAPAS